MNIEAAAASEALLSETIAANAPTTYATISDAGSCDIDSARC